MQGIHIIMLFKKKSLKVLNLVFMSCAVLGCGSGGSEPMVTAPVVIPAVVIPQVIDLEPPVGFTKITLQSTIEKVQPMTGIVFWDDHQVWDSTNKNAMSEAISLEFSYISINEIVTNEGIYDWSYLDNKLNEIAARNHQAIFRLYYAYPGRDTTVPNNIKSRSDYNETEGVSEDQPTFFPDWSNSELQRFTKEFHTQFSERYDNDNRLAFIQFGFGLWGEYHIYDKPGTLILGQTFPTKTYQTEFITHLETTYSTLPWAISIDASNSDYSPFISSNALLSIDFGLFDDSFMHEQHSGYNESAWNTFSYSERYKAAPLGGEFSYEEVSDQLTALTPGEGSYGTSYEEFAEKFHISYIIGNDTYTRGTSNEQPISRIKEASIFSGYSLSITGFSTNATTSEVVVENTGVAPLYYDAYITVNGVRATDSLKGLLPNASQLFVVESGGETPVLTIESDHILTTQTIEFNADL